MFGCYPSTGIDHATKACVVYLSFPAISSKAHKIKVNWYIIGELLTFCIYFDTFITSILSVNMLQFTVYCAFLFFNKKLQIK